MKKFVAIGHVDHGKSALCGHLLYKCGCVDEHEFEIIKREAEKDGMSKWIWSRILDIDPEERRKGKTHEFNVVDFSYSGKDYQMIDTPGHHSFIHHMIDGISHDVNIAMLLISMKDNEFEAGFGKGMLKEHLVLARAVGIEHLVIVANKMDIINWDRKVYETNVGKVKRFLKALNWPESCIHEVPISAFLGINLIEPMELEEAKWYQITPYKGEPLLSVLDSISGERTVESVDKLTECNKLACDIRVLNSGTGVITAGYTCVMHFGECKYEVELDSIPKGGPILRSKDKAICIIKALGDTKMKLGSGGRVVFRKDGATIGFGKVIKVKND